MVTDKEPVVVINIFNITDNKMFGVYAKEMFTQIYPAVGANIYFTGDPEGDRWVAGAFCLPESLFRESG